MDLGNYLDWAIYVLLLCYYLLYHKEEIMSDGHKVLSSLVLILIFYRSFTYLRLVSIFTYLVGMINTIMQQLIIFFVIVLYFLFTTVLLMMKLHPEGTTKSVFANAYVFAFFGGIGGDDFDLFDYVSIPIVFGTIVVTVILMNILIAFLSNLFSRLEEQQKINNLKEIIGMIRDLEVIVFFFSYWLTRKNKTLKEFIESKESSLDTSLEYYRPDQNDNKNGQNVNQITSHKDQKISKMIENMNYVYIFKTLDYEDGLKNDSINDNIYGKVKSLINFQKSIENKLSNHIKHQTEHNAKMDKTLNQFVEKINSLKTSQKVISEEIKSFFKSKIKIE